MKILIADDHELVRRGLSAALMELDGDPEFLEARDLSQVRELIGNHPGIVLVLLDLKMPGMDGFSGLKEIRDEAPDIPIAIISGFEEPWAVRQALEHGAVGYVAKSSPSEVVLSAVRLILAGGIYLPPLMLNEIQKRTLGGAETGGEGSGEGPGSASASLTARQQEVLSLLRQGKSNKEIARELRLSEGTVKKHVTAILRALNMTTRGKVIAAGTDLDT